MRRHASTTSSAAPSLIRNTMPASTSAGAGSSCSSASVTIPSVPSLPVNRSIQSMPGASGYPAVFLVVSGSGSSGTSKSILSPRCNCSTRPSIRRHSQAENVAACAAVAKAARSTGVGGNGATDAGGALGRVGRVELAGARGLRLAAHRAILPGRRWHVQGRFPAAGIFRARPPIRPIAARSRQLTPCGRPPWSGECSRGWPPRSFPTARLPTPEPTMRSASPRNPDASSIVMLEF